MIVDFVRGHWLALHAAPSVARTSQVMELNGINMNNIESCMIFCVSMFKLFFVVYCTPNLVVRFDVFDVGQVLISTKFTNISLQQSVYHRPTYFSRAVILPS